MKYFSVLLFLTLLTTSCYRMPTDDDFCTIPTTNNPSITKEKQASPIPAMNY